jgi:hypothetical protein
MPDSPILDSVDALRALYPEPAANSPVIKKQRATLNRHCREFIAHSPFLVNAPRRWCAPSCGSPTRGRRPRA